MPYQISDGRSLDSLTRRVVVSPDNPSFTLAPGMFLQSMVFNPRNSDHVSIGLTPGGSEFEEDFVLTAGDDATATIDQRFNTKTNFYISGLTAEILITLYLR